MANMHLKSGLEGWCMLLLTSTSHPFLAVSKLTIKEFGSPTPWTPEEVTVYCAKLRNELDEGYHIFQYHRQVYAQKPLDDASKKEPEQPVVENVAEATA